MHAEPLDAAGAIATAESFLTELETFFAGVAGFGDLTVGKRERLNTAIVDAIRPIEEGNAPTTRLPREPSSRTCGRRALTLTSTKYVVQEQYWWIQSPGFTLETLVDADRSLLAGGVTELRRVDIAPDATSAD